MLARRRKELKAQLAAKRANGVADLVAKALAGSFMPRHRTRTT